MRVYMSLVHSMSRVDRHCGLTRGGWGQRSATGSQESLRFEAFVTMEMIVSLTVKSNAGMGVQRLRWIMARRLGRWPSLAPAKNNLRETTLPLWFNTHSVIIFD